MKIVDKTQNMKTRFDLLEKEEIFRFGNRLFMKVSMKASDYGDDINAYDFDKHELTSFAGDTEVQCIPAELILHGRGWKG